MTLRVLRRFVLSLGLLAAATAHAAQIEGQTFDERIQVAGSELRLNGVGMRAVAWFKGYTAGLYLSRTARDAAQVIAAPGPKRVQMRMMREAGAEVFVKAFHGGVEGNCSEAERAQLAPRMAAFDRNMRGLVKVKQGDIVDLDYVPERGLVLSLNGRVSGEPVPGEDLYAAVLKIFVGEHPVDKKMKVGLLGGAT
jgi:chalcone isomerase-like protein